MHHARTNRLATWTQPQKQNKVVEHECVTVNCTGAFGLLMFSKDL